jgi:hypothetical protein
MPAPCCACVACLMPCSYVCLAPSLVPGLLCPLCMLCCYALLCMYNNRRTLYPAIMGVCINNAPIIRLYNRGLFPGLYVGVLFFISHATIIAHLKVQ